MDLTIEEARNLVADPVLWPKVRELLWNFVPQIHPSWIEPLKVEGRPFDASSRHVKTWVLERLAVEPCFHDFPKDDWSRLLLLDGLTLLDICKWLGAIACSDALRQVTSGAAVRSLKAGLSGAYPDAFGYSMYFKGLKIDDLKVDGAESVIVVGWGLMQALVKNMPEALKRRLAFKMPQSFSTLQAPDFKPSTIKHFNMPLLLKLRFPEAYKLCCS